jgi:hypothetical protein
MVMARAYETVPLGLNGSPKMITRISQLEITWRPDAIEELNPAPLFDMTRYVREYTGRSDFMAEWKKFSEIQHKTTTGHVACGVRA